MVPGVAICHRTVALSLQLCSRSLNPGYNGAILAYGQTGSGKTHTMLLDATLVHAICIQHAPVPTTLGSGLRTPPGWTPSTLGLTIRSCMKQRMHFCLDHPVAPLCLQDVDSQSIGIIPRALQAAIRRQFGELRPSWPSIGYSWCRSWWTTPPIPMALCSCVHHTQKPYRESMHLTAQSVRHCQTRSSQPSGIRASLQVEIYNENVLDTYAAKKTRQPSVDCRRLSKFLPHFHLQPRTCLLRWAGPSWETCHPLRRCVIGPSSQVLLQQGRLKPVQTQASRRRICSCPPSPRRLSGPCARHAGHSTFSCQLL